MLWAGQMMRSKRLQKVMAEMTHRVAQLLDEELKSNKEVISDWLQYPHPQSVSPKRNYKQLEQMDSKVWYPEMLPPSCKNMTARDRQRNYLKELAEKKKLAIHQAKVDQQVKS